MYIYYAMLWYDESSTGKKSTLSDLQAVVADIWNDREYTEAEVARIRSELNEYLREIKLFITPTRPRHISDVDEKSLREVLKQEMDNIVTIWSELHVRDKRTVTLREIQELKRVRDLVRAGKMWESVELAPGQEQISDEERVQRVELLQSQIAEVNEARGRHKGLKPEEIKDEADYELAWSEFVQLMYRWTAGWPYPCNRPKWPEHWLPLSKRRRAGEFTPRPRPYWLRPREEAGWVVQDVCHAAGQQGEPDPALEADDLAILELVFNKAMMGGK